MLSGDHVSSISKRMLEATQVERLGAHCGDHISIIFGMLEVTQVGWLVTFSGDRISGA